MKKIVKYIIGFIIAYFVLDFLTYFVTKPYYRDFYNYEILTESPAIQVTEAKSSYSKGYIKGIAKNTTGELIDEACVKAEIYKENGDFLGYKYYDISYFNPQEEDKFEIYYSYKDVGNIKLSIVEGNPQKMGQITIDEEIEKYVPFLGLAVILYLIP